MRTLESGVREWQRSAFRRNSPFESEPCSSVLARGCSRVHRTVSVQTALTPARILGCCGIPGYKTPAAPVTIRSADFEASRTTWEL